MKVFLSYAMSDRAIAEKIRLKLSSAGLDVLDSEEFLVPGENWASRIGDALEGSGAMVVVLEPVDGVCRVTFRDSGPGIPADVREKVFTAFFTTKARGTGLGLPTAKRIIEAHGGSIAIQCPPGGGTTVELTLPLPTGPYT